MNVHWEHKKRRSGGMSNPTSTSGTSSAMGNGALGGKLIGAGGGGFLMFYAEDTARLRKAMRQGRAAGGAVPVRFRGHEGASFSAAAAPAPVAILAGGLATRLRPLTETIPRR